MMAWLEFLFLVEFIFAKVRNIYGTDNFNLAIVIGDLINMRLKTVYLIFICLDWRLSPSIYFL